MTFHQKLEILCKNRGTTVTALAKDIGLSSSAGTTWKNSKRMPRNSTLKKIADHFEISIEELEEGIDAPLDFDNLDTSAFNQGVWQQLLKNNNFDVRVAYAAYQRFEQAQAEDAAKDQANYIQDNHGIVGHAHAPVTIINGSERKLTEQELALLNIFERLDVVKQSQLLSFAADLDK